VIVPLHAANPSAMTGSGNWTYFLPGRYPSLIDAGVGAEAHVNAIAQARPDGPRHVLVTHAHSDHISGAEAIRSRWPDTTFAKLPWPDRDNRLAIEWQPLHDGQVIAAGDGALEVVHTPGHAPDHLAFWDAATKTLFSGDLVVPGTTVVIPASMGGSLAAYLRSLERVLLLGPERLLPAHGTPIDDPAEIINRYIAHRLEREQQVLGGLRDGARTIAALVERIYIGLNPALVAMARESVLAHLRKLEEDGIAHREGEEWALY
jgi:hydroxyacylglutathione hydrolase